MKAKRLISLLLMLVLIGSLAGCGSSTPASSATPSAASSESASASPAASPAAKKDFNISLATGGTGGAYYVMGAGFAKLADMYKSRLKFTVSNTGASTENINLLQDGTVNFAIVQADSPYFAQLADREFKGAKPFPELRAVYGGHSSITHLVVREDSGITDIKQLRGKSIAIAPAGSPTVFFHRAYLAAAGLEEGAYTEQYLSYAEMGQAIANNTCDAVMIFNTTPNSPVIEAATSTKLRILGLTQEQQDAIVKQYPYIAPCTIPAGTYDFEDKDIITIGALAIVVTTTAVPNDVVYDFCALIGDHYDDVCALHSAGKYWDLENAAEGLAIQIHDGAKQYFTDKGILK